MLLVLTFLVGLFAYSSGLDNGIFDDHHGRSGAFKYMQGPLVQPIDPTGPSKKLIEFTKTEFLTPQIVRVTDNVYAAIGYALGNSIIIEGKNAIHVTKDDGFRQQYTVLIQV